MKGTIVNVLAIVIASLIGTSLKERFPENVRITVMQGLAMVVLLIGLKMALSTSNILILLVSIVIGSIIGEAIKIEERLENIGKNLERKLGSHDAVARAFLTSSLVFCVGPMAIIGAIQDGLNNDAALLYIKSMLDGTAALAFSSVMGIGVIFSSISVLVYQGSITILASTISPHLTEKVVNEIVSVGGLLIFGIGINLLEIKKIKVGNMLPALIISPILAKLFL